LLHESSSFFNPIFYATSPPNALTILKDDNVTRTMPIYKPAFRPTTSKLEPTTSEESYTDAEEQGYKEESDQADPIQGLANRWLCWDRGEDDREEVWSSAGGGKACAP
jgi:hypothetical protein